MPHTRALLPLAGITFANQPVATASAAQNVTIYNSGASAAAVTSIAVEGGTWPGKPDPQPSVILADNPLLPG